MARRKQEEPIPDELLAMSLADLVQLNNSHFSDEETAKFDALVAERDAAQAKLEARNHYWYNVGRAVVQKMREKNEKLAEILG